MGISGHEDGEDDSSTRMFVRDQSQKRSKGLDCDFNKKIRFQPQIS